MSKTQTPTLAELRELRENVAALYRMVGRPEFEESRITDLATIDALIAAHLEEGEKQG